MSSIQELFGGAITVILPPSLTNVSEIRQVPDTQEVFIAEPNVSYVVEVLQRVVPSDPKDAARFHFDALATDNEASESIVLSIDSSGDPSHSRSTLAKEAEGSSRAAHTGDLGAEMGETSISRDEKNIKDLEQSTPTPIILHGIQSIAKFNRKVADTVQILLALYRIESKSIDLVLTANLPVKTEAGDGLTSEQLDEAKAVFAHAAYSLHIVDFGLFA